MVPVVNKILVRVTWRLCRPNNLQGKGKGGGVILDVPEDTRTRLIVPVLRNHVVEAQALNRTCGMGTRSTVYTVKKPRDRGSTTCRGRRNALRPILSVLKETT